MTQGAYQTPYCHLKPNKSTKNQDGLVGSEYGSRFERDLVNYMNAYNTSLREIRALVRLYDWSACKVKLHHFNLLFYPHSFCKVY